MKLPVSLPDELLLSRLNRYITVSGDNGAHFACKIFGSRKVSIHPFLTARLEQLAEWSNESAEVMLFQQTLAPLFFFFLPIYADKLKRAMLVGDGAMAHRSSQLSLFGTGNLLCLKWCPVCAQKDIHQHGVAYWHRIHQMPGLTACAFHPVLLERIDLANRQRVIIGLFPPLIDHTRLSSEVEFQVAKFGFKLSQLLIDGVPCFDTALAYRSKLSELGLITACHRIRRKNLMAEFSIYAKQYRNCPETPLPRCVHDYRYLSQLLEPQTSHHPFRHLLFSNWLFCEPENMLSEKLVSTELIQPVLLETAEHKLNVELQCLQLLHQQCSLNKIYEITGKSRCYLRRLALLNNISLRLKPRKLNKECQKKIIRLAYAGMHRMAISKQCDISVGLVEQVISSQPGLVERRKKCHWESKRRRSRIEIVKYLKSHPNGIRTEYKTQCNVAFFWLYRNDPIWLNSILPEPVKPAGRYS